MLMWPLKPRRKDRSVAAERQAGRHGAVGPVAGRTSASSAIQRTGRPLAVVYWARFSLESGPRCRISGRARSPAARSTSRRLGRPMSSPCRIATRAGTSTRARARGYPPKAAAAAWWRGLRPRRREGTGQGPMTRPTRPPPNAAGTRCPPLAVRLKLAGTTPAQPGDSFAPQRNHGPRGSASAS